MSRLMRTAATASMVSSARLNSAQRKAVQSSAAAPAPAAMASTPVAPAAGTDPLVAQLQQLATLNAQGILTNEEFAAKKKQLLGI
mgnify:FL=1